MVSIITPRPNRSRPPPALLLLAAIALFAILWWVLSGPAGSVSGQPCYRGWLRIVVAKTDQDQLGWTLLRHAVLPVGGPQESRVYVQPASGATDAIRDITLHAFRIWAPGRDAASVQRSLDDTGSTPISVEPLCGSLGATELIIPVAVTVILCALVFVVGIWWYRFRAGAS